MAFGQESLAETLDSSPEQSGSEQQNLDNSTGSTTQESNPQLDPNTGQLIEIDSPDRYRYKGRPLSEYENGYMRQQDYSQKTAQIAQERKYYDNLSVDLDRVRQNPSLAEQFRGIYPEKFHAYLRYVQSENSGQNSQQRPQQQNQYARLDPAMEQRINFLEKGFRDKEVAAISAELDNKFKTLSEKYPFADEEAVVARAQALLAKMKDHDPSNPSPRISDNQWDALWKSQHERAHGLSDAQYKKQVQSQIQANRKGSETGQGGGIAGHAPRQYKTIKEATNQALADIELGSL